MVSAKAFVIRSKLTGVREQSVSQLVEKLKSDLQIDTELITDYDTDDIDVEKVKNFVDLNKSEKSEFFDSLVRNMHIRSVSNAMKHYTTLKKALDTECDYVLIFEDDVLFGENMTVKLKEILDSDQSWDICFTGLPSVTPIADHDKLTFQDVKSSFKLLPSCDAYIIRKSSLAKVVDAFLPIRFPTNIHISFIAETTPLDVKYVVPNLFVDGSKMGIYLSSIESNNKLYMNPEYNQLSQIVKKDQPLTDSDKSEIDKLFEQVRFKNHPDIQLLQGLYFEECGEYEKARDKYKEAHSIQQQNGCIINNESEVLNKLISIQKHFQ